MKYEARVQEGDNKVIDVVGFGEASYQQVKKFSDSKSPVKLQLFPPGQGFSKEVIGQRSEIVTATHVDVPFEYSIDLADSTSSSQEPIKRDITQLLDKSNFSTSTLYSVSGKLHVGPNIPKLVPSIKKRVKDDVTLFDVTGNQIKIGVFEPLIAELQHGIMVEIVPVKTRMYRSDTIITLVTTPDTRINVIDDVPEIVIPDDFIAQNYEEDAIEVAEFDSVTKFSWSSTCGYCEHRVPDNAIRIKAYDCERCQETYRIKHLRKGYMVPLRVNEHIYTASAEVITKLLGCNLKEETEIRDALLDLNDMRIIYNKNTNVVTSIVTK